MLESTLNFWVEGALLTADTALALEVLAADEATLSLPVRVPAQGEISLHAWGDPTELRVNVRPCESVCGPPWEPIEESERLASENLFMNLYRSPRSP